MDEASDGASNLSWIWVIEALASFKEVDVSILHDLIEMAPELPDNLGGNMREMLALRCLEVLFGSSSGITSDACSSIASKDGFDISKSCEDVLEHILQETSLSDLKMAGPELSKWDAHTFIIHKRACMSKLALQQLKDSILEGSHPYADSLKERSGLVFTNAGDRVPVNNGNHNVLAQRGNGSCFDTQHMGAKGHLMPRIIENGNKLLENDLCTGNLLPSKRKRNALATENTVEDCHENRNILNDCDDPYINTKKQKQFASSSIHSIEVNTVPLNGTEHLEFSSERIMPIAEVESCDLAKDQIGTLEEGRILEYNHNEHTASMKCGHSADNEFHHIQLEIPDSGTMMPADTSGDKPCQNISVDEDKYDSEHCAEQRPLGALPPYSATMLVQETSLDEPCQKISVDEIKDDREQCAEPKTSSGPLLEQTQENESQCNHEHVFQLKAPYAASLGGSKQKIIAHEAVEDMDRFCEAGTASDSDGYHNDNIDVSIKKHEFLSSQCTYNNDSSAGWTDQNFCMKCNEGGQLLVCSTSTCPVVVHEICLGSSPRFGNNGNFYCPFCAYSLSILEYLEAKKKASLERKELTKFFRMGMEPKPKEP